MAGHESAAAGDARWLERRQRRAERVDPGEMRTVGARARRQLGMTVDEQCGALLLHCGRQRLDAVDATALVGLGQA